MTPANDNRKDGSLPRSETIFAMAASAVVVLAILAGLLIGDSPWVVRERRLDQTLMQHLNAVQSAINAYHRANAKLPANLADLLASPQTAPFGVTAETLKEIAFVPGANGHDYQLCGQFLRASGDDSAFYATNWKHAAGRVCFDMKVPEKASALDAPGDTYFVVARQRL